MTSVLKKSRGIKGKSVSMQDDLPSRGENISRGNRTEDVAKLVKCIDDNVIGKGTSFCGPFGRRKVVYCDYSGSGRSLQFLEEHVACDVLPTHATECTALSHTSGQTSLYRSEAQALVRAAVGACSDDVAVLGASLARFLRALRPQRVALFVSSRETERQLAPWRECSAEIIKIPETKEGFIDLNTLEQKLQENSGTGKRMIGFFAAASKLTGVLADDVATTLLLHQYGAWAFWDYTLVAPTAAVDMNPTFPGVEENTVKKDAVFFNCEKFVGGVQGPFVAVVKKDVFKNSPLYSDDIEIMRERLEEWRSTEAVRAALVMQLRDAVGLKHIANRQDKITRQVLAHIKNIPELILLGSESPTVRRLPIFSLMVKHPRGTFLHHNFVCAVLNDVFGIQARGGLNSNLSYGQDILGIDEQLLREYEKLLDVKLQKELASGKRNIDPRHSDSPIHNEHLRPGFCRISLPFFMSESEVAFVLEALKMVATEGWKILPQYVVNPQTGQWRHHSHSSIRDRKSLFSLRFHDGKMTSNERKISGPGIFPQTYTECLQTARNLFNRARKLAMKCSTAEPEMAFNPRIDYLRWFMLPKEAHELLLGKSANVKHIVPFDPSGYTGARKSLNSSRGFNVSSPILGSSPRHFSLSALDDCQIIRSKQKQKFFSRESSLKEKHPEETGKADVYKPPPVQFALGDSVSPIHVGPLALSMQPVMMRSRCYSLGSDLSPSALSPQTKMNLGLKETSPEVTEKPSNYCNCGSQTDLQSLDDPMISPTKIFPYNIQTSTSISDCSQVGRTSPTTSVASHNSEDLHAYLKEMTKEIATEIKSEIREVISQVDDILDNSDAVDMSNVSLNSVSSQGERNSVSIVDVAQYLMGVSKEMASEVKHEIREMVNQVDEMISPEYGGCGLRKNSPPNTGRKRICSGPNLGLDLTKTPQSLRKCPTSPVLPSQCTDDDDPRFCKRSHKSPSPRTPHGTPPRDALGSNNLSFNSSETSTPETIVQAVTDSTTLPKSLSTTKLSDDEVDCCDAFCRHYCNKKNWCQNPSVSSQDSGINMTFTETESYHDFVKCRTSSDPTTNNAKRLQGRLRMCQRHEKSEVPDIIEGVPVCSGDHTRHPKHYKDSNTDSSRVAFQITSENDSRTSNRSAIEYMKRSRVSASSSSSSSSRSSGSSTDDTRKRLTTQKEIDYDIRNIDEREPLSDEERGVISDSSAGTDSSLTDFTFDDDGKWHCPPKPIWKATLEALHEYNMIRPGDKVLVCLSGGRDSLSLLHSLHQYQYYARAKGIHFSIGALFVHEPKSEVDPLHLMAYCRTLGVKLIYQDKLEDEESDKHNRSCRTHESHRWATHGVRRRAYSAAAAHGYTVAALAQHFDHAARAFVANVFHGGALRTMKAHYRIREHDLRIIRPFIYVREKQLDAFATARMLPDFRSDANIAALKERREHGSDQSDDSCGEVAKEMALRDRSISEPCSISDEKELPERSRSLSEPWDAARDILSYQERLHPCLFISLKSALHPLISARNIEKDLKERHRKKSVIQMKNGAPVYDSEEGTEEEPVP